MFYKFLDKKYVAGTQAGKLKFGRLRYYQLLEVFTGDQWIGDRNEGVATTKVNATMREGDPQDAVLLQRLSEAGVLKLGSGGGACVEMHGVIIRNVVDCFVFCFSAGEIEHLASSMSSPCRAKYAYDGCLRLLDPNEIAQRIWAYGMVDGKPLPELFKSLHLGPVSYEWAERDLSDGPIASGDPFVKSAGYIEQREWRFVLIPHASIEEDGLFVECEAISDLLVEEALNVPARSHAAGDLRKAPDIDAIVKEIQGIWLNWDAKFDRFSHAEEPPRMGFQNSPADVARFRAAFHAQSERQSKRLKELGEEFDLDARPRLIALYFEVRSVEEVRKRHPRTFAKIDSALIFHAPPSILRTRFSAQPFYPGWPE